MPDGMHLIGDEAYLAADRMVLPYSGQPHDLQVYFLERQAIGHDLRPVYHSGSS